MIIDKKDVTPENLERELNILAGRLNLTNIDEAKHFPKYFQLETSRVCNATCPFCAIDKWDKTTPFMSDELFEKCALEIAQYKDWVEWVCISRAGEPTLDKKIVPRVKRLKELGVRNVNLSTNVQLLPAKRCRELMEAGIDEIWISIDSIDKEAYLKSRVGLNYEKVIQNVKDLFRLRKEINPQIQVRVRGVALMDLESQEGKEELKRWEDFWDLHRMPQDRIYMKKPHNWGNQVDMEGFRDGMADYGEIYHPCIIPFSTMHITAMGTIGLCAMDYDGVAKLGDVNIQTIQEVWQGDKLERYRMMHRSGLRNQEKMCIGCKLFDLDFSIEDKEYKKYIEERNKREKLENIQAQN